MGVADLGVAPRTGDERRNGHRSPGGAGAGRPRARSVPGGRAVLGGFLVAAAVVGLFWASSRPGAPSARYVVAGRDIAPGARLAAGDLRLQALDLPPALAGRAFSDPAALEGAVAVGPLAAGELVQASAVVAKPSSPSSREVSVAVPAATLPPGLETGERIDLVATFGAGGDAFSTYVVRQAQIVGIHRLGRDERDATVTVALDDAGEAIALAHASQQAKLTVVRATGAPPVAANPPAYRATGASGGRS